jgi:hypothetical protein
VALSQFDSTARAARHPIVRRTPAVDFFEGALLGNGGLGAVVCTRPDAVMVHFGHNNVWDIRIHESNKDKYGTFREVFERVKSVPATAKRLDEDEWCREYFKMAREGYAKPYPRPFPCGTLVLGFDRREAELLGHRLDIATGMCEVEFLLRGQRATLQLFVDMQTDRLWLRMEADLFNRVRLIPHADSSGLPAPTTAEQPLSFRQVLPFQETGEHPKDRAFRLAVCLNRALEVRTRTNTVSGLPETMGASERGILPGKEFVACVQLDEGLASALPVEAGLPALAGFTKAAAASREVWCEYWSKSGVALDDEFLERIWYWNLYFLNCSARAGVTCPGLFANWSLRNIGTAWHGDYHMNYNTQQPFWVTFSSNHVDKHLPYVELVERVLPLEQQWAREYYGLRGVYGMHSLYPVEMTTNPYPVPTWGWEICETPWTMQSLWWHYLYTQDKDFLERRAFGPIREAVLFLVDYMKRPEARGPQWGDDRYHIFPTVPPELYGLRPGFAKNHDCLVDLTLTKFIFKAYRQACAILGREEELLDDVNEILAHFPEYPTADTPAGKVFVSVPGENPEIVQNTPNSAMTVFPGEDHGLHSPPAEFEIAARSYRQQRNEGGNELVFLNLQGARLGLLDLEKFKRQVEYCLLPNGTCTDKCLQAHGRYSDTTQFDWMAKSGIWFENFALPVVINECLLQSYTGVLRLFPNWPKDKPAEFHTLRAVGAFLVSAALADGAVQWVTIHSEKGARLRILNPWLTGAKLKRNTGDQVVRAELIETDTLPGETIQIYETHDYRS